jgi:hypothetical protein
MLYNAKYIRYLTSNNNHKLLQITSHETIIGCLPEFRMLKSGPVELSRS